MDKKELRDLKFIMSVLDNSRKKDIEVPELEGLESEILRQVEVRELKKEINILRRLEYGLVVGIFLLFVLLFPRGMYDRIKSSYPGSTITSSSIEDVIYEVQREISSYLDEEYELNSLGLENILLDYEDTY